MSDELTDDELDAIWDDESGTPPPMTAAQMDERLIAYTERMREERLAFEAQTASVHELIVQYESTLEGVRKDAGRFPETAQLRDQLLRLAKRTLTVAKAL